MASTTNNSSIFRLEPSLKQQVLSATRASAIEHEVHVQSLWSGYGQISRLALRNPVQNKQALDSVIVKLVSPPATQNHPRGWNTDASSKRKIQSYEIETNWYRQYATHGDHRCAMPKHYASHHGSGHTWLILEDLDKRFPVRHEHLTIQQCKPCLRWLARFHAQHLHQSPVGLWPTGTYWHLDTRKEEFDAMEAGKLKEAAIPIDQVLNSTRFMSFVHGDAKVANFCFTKDSTEVAMVDFQYVGRGCGVKDVAYFLGSALSDEQCQLHADTLLDFYFSELGKNVPPHDYELLETQWRELNCYAWADFHRFLAGWMPEHKKVNNYMQGMTVQALKKLSDYQ